MLYGIFAAKSTLGYEPGGNQMFRAKLVLLFATSCLAAFGSTIVVPNGNTSTVGNDTDSPDSGDLRVQQLIGSGQFASVGGSLLIDQLSFRLAPGTGSGAESMTNLNLSLSTSQKSPSTISTTFADNVGSDNTLVFSGPFYGLISRLRRSRSMSVRHQRKLHDSLLV
jgi:hypothetical protein